MKNLRIRILLLVFYALLFGHSSFAQQKYLTISGNVIDSVTGTAVPFASIGIVGETVGTTTNAEGRFIFKIPALYQNSQLRISCTGYQPAIKPIEGSTSGVLEISLKPASILLDEVLVQSKRRTAEEILIGAVAAIPKNYDTTAVQLTAFYREDTRLDDFGISFNEAVVGVYKSPVSNPDMEDQMIILKGRKKEFDHSKDPRFYGWLNLSGGAKGALKTSDLVKLYIKRHRNSFLNEKNFKYYKFSLNNILSYGGRNTYVIGMIPKKNNREAYVHGKLYIDVQTLAFTKWEIGLTKSGLDRENNNKFLLKKLGSAIMKATLKLDYVKETVIFSLYKDKWQLNNVQRDFKATVNSKKRNIENGLWQTNLIFAVTDINNINAKPYSEGDINQNEVSMGGLINAKEYDAKFWENYNIILPTAADTTGIWAKPDTVSSLKINNKATLVKPSNRQNGFTKADTLRGKLTSLRTCYDVSFYHLDVKVDIDKKSISGSNEMRFKVVEPFNKMQVDLYANMLIHKINYGNQELSFTREYDAVFVQFPEVLKQGTTQAITIFYSGIPKEPNRTIPMDGGFLWEKDKNGNPWVQVVCQGSGASLWWPNKDHQSDKPDSAKISISVPKGLMNISNGRLISKTELPGDWTKFDWQVSYPINNYNITLNIGKYAHTQDAYISDDTLTLDYYFMPYHAEKASLLFAEVKPMLAILEKNYGKYPFPRDGFTLMESLYPMEHQSAVSIGKLPEGNITDVEDLPQSLMWHEASHEWWGNSVTAKDIADMWIHEAFAEYSEALRLKAEYGDEGELGYMQGLPERVVGKEPVIGVYDVNHIHYNNEDMYSKAALVLHTFKSVLNNDSLWQSILYGIQQDFKYQTITTTDLVNYINEKTKTDYTYFFDQYLRFSSIPTLNIKLVSKGESVRAEYKWTADVKGFRMPVKVTKHKNKFDFIYPTTSWQTVLLKEIEPNDFKVETEKFYIKVEVD